MDRNESLRSTDDGMVNQIGGLELPNFAADEPDAGPLQKNLFDDRDGRSEQQIKSFLETPEATFLDIETQTISTEIPPVMGRELIDGEVLDDGKSMLGDISEQLPGGPLLELDSALNPSQSLDADAADRPLESNEAEDLAALDAYSDGVEQMTEEERAAMSASPRGVAMAAGATAIIEGIEGGWDAERAQQESSDALASLTEEDTFEPMSFEEIHERAPPDFNNPALVDGQALLVGETAMGTAGIAHAPTIDSMPDFDIGLSLQEPKGGQAAFIPMPQARSEPVVDRGAIGGAASHGQARDIGPTEATRPMLAPGQAVPKMGLGPAMPAMDQRMKRAHDNEAAQRGGDQLQMIDPVSRLLNLTAGAVYGTASGIANIAVKGFDMWRVSSFKKEQGTLNQNISAFQSNVVKFNDASNAEDVDQYSKQLKRDLLNIKAGISSSMETAALITDDQKKVDAFNLIQDNMGKVKAAAEGLKDGSGINVKDLSEQMKEIAEMIRLMVDAVSRFVTDKINAVMGVVMGGSRGGTQPSPSAAPSMSM